jgi:superfamily I DNA/RNA helicase
MGLYNVLHPASRLLLRYILEGLEPGLGNEAAGFQRFIKRRKIFPDMSFDDVYHDSDFEYDLELLKHVYAAYQKVLNGSYALDFEDLLDKGLQIVQRVPWAPPIARLTHVLVDELYVPASPS